MLIKTLYCETQNVARIGNQKTGKFKTESGGILSSIASQIYK